MNLPFKEKVWEHISDDAKDFLNKLLIKEPENRPTAEIALSHKWIRQGIKRKNSNNHFKKQIALPIYHNIKDYSNRCDLEEATINFIEHFLLTKK